MNLNKASLIGISILSCLVIIIVLILYDFIGPGAKDIKSAKYFISKLYSINAIDTQTDLKKINYERSKILKAQNNLVYRSIVTQNYGIDLDKDNNIIGFAKKEILTNETKINVEDAQNLAQKYLKNIYDGDVVLKEININDDNKRLPYYSFTYTKEKYGYKFYFDEIKLNIDKENGFLDSYSNSTMQRECKEPVINLSKEEAISIALDYFNKFNTKSVVNDYTDLVYANNRMGKEENSIYEVCYVINIDGQDDKNNNVNWKFFVSSDSGDILNILKNGADKEVKTQK